MLCYAERYTCPEFYDPTTNGGSTPIIMPSEVDARRRSGRRVATLAPRPSQPDGALAPPSPQRSHSPPPPQTELQVCVRHSQRRAVRHTHLPTQARLTRRAEMRAILAHVQVLVAAAAAARSVECDAAPSTALMMVSVCAAPCAVPCLTRDAPVRCACAPIAGGRGRWVERRGQLDRPRRRRRGGRRARGERPLVGPPLPHTPAHRHSNLNPLRTRVRTGPR